MNFRFTRALVTGKLGDKAISIINKKRGTVWAGRKAIEIDPDLFAEFSGIDPVRVIFITGTNGKSTVSSLIRHILTSKGYSVLTNAGGANMTNGIASALVKGSDFSGRISADYIVLEVDERYLKQIMKQIPCGTLVVTNLEKDQAQRNGDPDFIYRKIASCIDGSGIRLILNGDEPRTCSLADHSNNVIFYSVERHGLAFEKDDTFVTQPCPKCRSRIVFDYYNNDGMGGFRCAECGFTASNGRVPDYEVTDVDFDKKTFSVNGTTFTMPYEQPYMMYNYAAAIAACKEAAGVTEAEAAENMGFFVLPDGRIESYEYNGQLIRYYRFKQENPETFQNFISAAARDHRDKVLVVGFGVVDTFDPYYISSFYAFDCDYSGLADANVRKIICVTETVAYDVANCFIYGGMDPSLIEVIPTSDAKEIYKAIRDCGCNSIYLSVNMSLFEKMKEFALKER